ncbi:MULTISPECIES: DUF2062 domain-containing protein [Trichocoleus]|uniref:DUF2062 domain-containing protein n=1 Tax=Trichocoleus desertorum GB2-A4 TaxID=2933944 RepID=A0ABV0JAW0_9CYAN|nr:MULTISPECIES: DUF2062 domain-containing protein [unclassified Trichocoleus]MBD1861496.1 DUF2062 domain-containing protein [Trichocoleus sp. FACHB-46]MBD2096955.1 DUF2062 domain-containing protein [Trichocoleus sp. FACHB-591]
MKQWQRGLRYLYLRFVRLQATPEQISRGFALGIFWGMFPLPGLQMAIAVVSAAVVRGSKLAAAAGTWFSNPLTTLPLTAFNFHVGQSVLGREWEDLPTENLRSLDSFLALGTDFITGYLMGCLIVGLAFAVVSYFVGIPVVDAIQRRNAARRLKRRKARFYKPLKYRDRSQLH